MEEHNIAFTTRRPKSQRQMQEIQLTVSESEYKHSQSTVEYAKAQYGNPTPLGLSAFALSVMVTSIYDIGLLGIDRMDMAVGVALFTGGVVQLAAGLWEFKVGNTFGATGFSAFGGFWASYGVIFLKGFGIMEAYDGKVDGEEFSHAIAIYYTAWTIFTFIFTLACLRTNLGILMSFVFLTLDFFCLSLSAALTIPIFTRIAGIFGIICSSIVWYCFAAVLLTPDLSPISLPLYDLSKKESRSIDNFN